MNFRQKMFAGLIALLPLLSLGLVTDVAHAQHTNTTASAPRIDGFDVDEVRNLTPGTELAFTLYGTPGGTATLLIVGAQRNLTLTEVDSGQYEGTYTISSRDTITAQSGVTANLRLGNQVASSRLSESLLASVGYHAPKQVGGPAPKITRFDVQPSTDLGPGSELAFSLYGTPGGKVDISIAGAKGKFFLQEVKSGEYAGIYTVRNRDRIASNSAVTANLRIGEHVVSTTLGKGLQTSAAPVARAGRLCGNCGTVEAVNVVEVKGDGSYLGTIGGGVVGALIGSQVGKGSGKTAAEILGAVGGAYAGREVEKNVKKTSHQEVVVRLQNGGTQTLAFDKESGYLVGDKVRIVDGGLQRDQ